MSKFVILALVAAAFAGAQASGSENIRVGGEGGQLSEAELQEQANEYKNSYLNFKGLSPNVLKECQGNGEFDSSKIVYHFYRLNSVESKSLTDPDFPPRSVFNTTFKTKIYLQGWLEQHEHKVFHDMSLTYASRYGKVNLVVLDWTKYAECFDYFSSRTLSHETIKKIADHVSEMLRALINKGVNEKQIHLVGFDVGAHIAGLAAKRITPKIARVTGLSPAGRIYNMMEESDRLARGDADFVDVIHTDMNGYGIWKAIGDIDFLPHGGISPQPLAEEVQGEIQHMYSHQAARKYYNESIGFGYAGFIGKQCNSWSEFIKQGCALNRVSIMGESVSVCESGSVYLSVNKVSPYSKGIAGVYAAGITSQSRMLI